ncbi:hypothetical protein KY285_029815 [Solanum tuberosum]|nr:hypothetical protein KY285_029815 [Solanum tuberosum]
MERPGKDSNVETFRLCYESENDTIDAPMIVAHFTNVDFELSPSSTFAQVDEIGYDLVANKVSFLPTDCTKY